MPRETRSRITILLPAPTAEAHFALLDRIITQVIQFCGGATVSSLQPVVFDGWWIDGAGQTVPDANVMIIGDAPVDLDSQPLEMYLDDLKRRCQHDFNQDIVWITVMPVHRITTGDFHR